MPTARRVLVAAGLFAAVTSASLPALATPGSRGEGKTFRAALVNPSSNAAEHTHGRAGEAHGRRPTHPANPSHAGHRSSGRAHSVPNVHGDHGDRRVHGDHGDHGDRRVHGDHGDHGDRRVHGDRRTAAARVAAASATNNGKHRAEGGAKHARPGTSPAKAAKPATTHRGQGAGPAKSGAAAGRPAAASQSRATFDDATPQPLARPAVAARTATRPVAHRSKPRSPSTSTKAGPVNPVLGVTPKQVFAPLGRALTNLTGIGLFSGPQGWIFTGMFVMAVVMMGGAFALGRRPRSIR